MTSNIGAGREGQVVVRRGATAQLHRWMAPTHHPTEILEAAR